MPVDQNYSVTLKNELPQIPVIVQQLLIEAQKVGPLSQRERCRMCLALEEAIRNALVHGNLEVDSKLKDAIDDDLFERKVEERQQASPYCDRSVEIVGWFNAEQVVFEITDEGPGFDVAQVPDPTQDDLLDCPSGRGIFLMRSCMDEVRFNSKGNQVTLVKNLSVAAETGAKLETEQIAT